MKSNVKVTESLFKAIKLLISCGATYDEIRDTYGVSLNTCARIKHSENYGEYKQMLAALAVQNKAYKQQKKEPKAVEAPAVEKSEPQVVEHRQSITIQATHYMMQEMQETNKLLKEISNKLAYIVEQLS